MVTSKVSMPDFTKKEIPFPKIMKRVGREVYILFEQEGLGTIVSCEVQDESNYIGKTCNQFKMVDYEDYEGYVILSNMHILSKGTLWLSQRLQ